MWYFIIPLLFFTMISLVFLYQKIIETNAITVERRIFQIVDNNIKRSRYYAIDHSLGFIEIPAPAMRSSGASKPGEKLVLTGGEKKSKTTASIPQTKSLNLLDSVVKKNQKSVLNETQMQEELGKVAQKIQKKEKEKEKKKKREKKEAELKRKNKGKSNGSGNGVEEEGGETMERETRRGSEEKGKLESVDPEKVSESKFEQKLEQKQIIYLCY